MLKKYIVSLLSLFIIFGAKQAFAADGQKKASPAIQQFFEAGNHDDAKLHMLGYLANHRNLASLVEEQGKFSDALKTLVNLKDKTLQQGLERLLAPINQNGQINVNARNIRIQCAQDAVKSGNQKMLETFLPEIFVENPQEHVLFPQDLRSDEAKEMLKETGLIDLAFRYHDDKNIAETIELKFFGIRNYLNWNALREYAPVYSANGRRTDMRVAIEADDKQKIQELLDGEKDRNKRLNAFRRIMIAMREQNTKDLHSFLEETFTEDKMSMDRTLLKEKRLHVMMVSILYSLIKSVPVIKLAVSYLFYRTIKALYNLGLEKTFILFTGMAFSLQTMMLSIGIMAMTSYIRSTIKRIAARMVGIPIAVCIGVYYFMVYKTIIQAIGAKNILYFVLTVLGGRSINLFGIRGTLRGLCRAGSATCKIANNFVLSPIKKIACAPVRGAVSFLRSPWQKTKNAFSSAYNVVRNPGHYISRAQTKLLQTVMIR